MYIVRYGGYTLPTEQLDMSESMGAGRRAARQELAGVGGALDAYGTGPDPLAADTISKAFIVEAASAAALQTAVDSFIGEMMLSQNDPQQGLRMLLARLPDGTKRQSWAKCVEARGMWEYHNVNEAWLPVQVTWERPWPVWEKFEDLLYLGDHLGTFADAAAAGWLFGPGPASLTAIARALLRCGFDNSDTGHLGQAATTTGPVVYGAGYTGQARQVAGGTTNLMRNPSVETNTTFISAYNSASISRVTSEYDIGAASLEVVCDGTANRGMHQVSAATGPWTASQVISVQMRIKAPAGKTFRFGFRGQKSAGGNQEVTPPLTATGQWQRVTYSYTLTENFNTVGLECYFETAQGALTFYVDAMQVEVGPPTPYLDGSLDDHAWTSTAHASTSTRPAATLRYANPLSATAGTLALRWKPACDQTGPTMYLFDEGGLKAYFDSADDTIKFSDGTNTISTAALTFSAEVWQSLIFTWSSSGLKIYRNGVEAATGATYSAPSLGADLYAGSDAVGANQANGLIDDLAVLDRAITAAEAAAISASTEPATYGSGVTEQEITTSPVTFTLNNTGNTRVMRGIIELDGPITNFTLTNTRNKYSLAWAGQLVAGDRLTINIASFDAKKNGVRGEWPNFSLGASRGQLVPMVLEPGANPMRIEATSPDCTFRFYWARSFS
jgi:hypothetical protein